MYRTAAHDPEQTSEYPGRGRPSRGTKRLVAPANRPSSLLNVVKDVEGSTISFSRAAWPASFTSGYSPHWIALSDLARPATLSSLSKTSEMMIDLNSLAIFAKVVETRSFSEAAKRLKMPISTVSRRVAELEDQLGSPGAVGPDVFRA